MKNCYANVFITGLMALLLSINSGCKKSDVPEPGLSLSSVKVYDDATASIENSSIHIAAGAGRIYMTYGIGKTNIYQFNSGGYFLVTGSYVNLNAIDNEGVLLWQRPLPVDIKINDILALDDGGCVAVGYGLLSSYIYLFHYDANGIVVKADSLLLQSASSDVQKIIRAVNGNILMYGPGYDTNGNSVGFAAEFDMNFSKLRENTYYGTGLAFSSCEVTPDGGYLFAGTVADPFAFSTGNIAIYKTNAAGDSLWSKTFTGGENAICNGIESMSNGNFCLGFTFSTGSSLNYQGIPETYVYEINAAGDSLNSARIDKGSQRNNNALVGLDNGGVYALMNSFVLPAATGSIWNQSNSSAVILNSTFTSGSGGFLQTETNNYFNDACKLSDGRVACAGLVQPNGQSYYKPCLLIY